MANWGTIARIGANLLAAGTVGFCGACAVEKNSVWEKNKGAAGTILASGVLLAAVTPKGAKYSWLKVNKVTGLIALAGILASCAALTAAKRTKLSETHDSSALANSKAWEEIQNEQDGINKLPTDKERVVAWHKKHAAQNPENYVVIDKKACEALVYSADGDVLTAFEVELGKEKGDELLKYRKENPIATTTAGIYTINYKGTGKDAYARLYNEDIYTITTDRGGETGAALHKIPNGNTGRRHLFYNGNLEDNRVTNGCINFLPEDFKKLEKYLKDGVGTKVYVLPEEDNNYIMVKNGKLHLAQKEYTGNVITSLPSCDSTQIHIVPSKIISQGNEFAQALETNKSKMMKELDIDNDTYNLLTNLSLGIAGQESQYGESSKYWWKENFQKSISLFKRIIGRHSFNSRGLTQIKIGSYTDLQTRELFKKFDITEENLGNPEKSAIATMIVLSCMYKNELPALKDKIAQLGMTKEEAVLYLWHGRKHEITKGTATPNENIYIKNVEKFAKNNFTIYQDES